MHGNNLVPVVEACCYTDPLCPWSWAMAPHWSRLRREFGPRLAWRDVMGGMIPNWQSYEDPVNCVHSPAQMGPQWYQVRRLLDVPLDERIWHEDPPSSSYPACLAVKAAGRQGVEAGAAYLHLVREAVMLRRRNVARGEVLAALAETLATAPPPAVVFDAGRFRDDLVGPEVRDAFHDDLRALRYAGIARLPTLTLRGPSGPGIALVGYRSYETLRDALWQLDPESRTPCAV
jgi:putative protein-disulfide isomerase